MFELLCCISNISIMQFERDISKEADNMEKHGVILAVWYFVIRECAGMKFAGNSPVLTGREYLQLGSRFDLELFE